MKTALVLGGATNVMVDVLAAKELGYFEGVVACNDIASRWPDQLDAFVTFHPEKLIGWMKHRSDKGFPPPKKIFVRDRWRSSVGMPGKVPQTEALGVTETHSRFAEQKSSGSSGLFALKVALIDLGFERAVCCGIPMDAWQGNIARNGKWDGAWPMRAGWVESFPFIGPRTRSMSGWTRDLLGAPTTDWIGHGN